MARVLGKSVIVCDSMVDGIPQGRVHTILLEDHEPVPISADELEAFLFGHADAKPMFATVMLDALDEEVSTDKAQKLLACLDAIKESAQSDAVKFVKGRFAK